MNRQQWQNWCVLRNALVVHILSMGVFIAHAVLLGVPNRLDGEYCFINHGRLTEVSSLVYYLVIAHYLSFLVTVPWLGVRVNEVWWLQKDCRSRAGADKPVKSNVASRGDQRENPPPPPQ